MAIYSGIQKKSFLKKLSRLVLSGLVSAGGVLATSDVAWAADKAYPIEDSSNYPISETETEPERKPPVYPTNDKVYATNVRFGYGNIGNPGPVYAYYLIGDGKNIVTVSKNSTGNVLDNILNTKIQDVQLFKQYDVFYDENNSPIYYVDKGYREHYQYGTRQVFNDATIIGVSSVVPGRQNYLQDGYIDSQGKKVYFLPGDVSGGHVVIDGVSGIKSVYGGSTSGGVVKNEVTTKDNISGEASYTVKIGTIAVNPTMGDTYLYAPDSTKPGGYDIIRGVSGDDAIPEPENNIYYFSANKNIVEIKNGATIGNDIGDVLCGGNATGDANYNAVYIENSTSNILYTNGNAGKSNKKGSALYNTFIAKDSDIKGVTGGYAQNGNASNNTVILVGSKTGTMDTYMVYGGNSVSNGKAENNTLFLVGKGGVFNDEVYYGSDVKKGITLKNDSGTVYAPVVTKVYVGMGSTSSNNTLAVSGTGSKIDCLSINEVQNFDFYIQKGLTFGDSEPMLTIEKSTIKEGMNDNAKPNLDLSDKHINVILDGTPKANGDDHTIKLIHYSDLEFARPIIVKRNEDGRIANASITVKQGATLEWNTTGSYIETEAVDNPYTGDIDPVVKNLVVHLEGLSGEGSPYYEDGNGGNGGKSPVNENGKSVVETRAAAAAIVNGAADFMLDAGIGQARAAVNEAASEGNNELVPFVSMGGNNMRYETGSYVDMQGWNAAGGFAKQTGNFMYGVAFEYGKGGYDSYLDNGVHANGDISSAGGVLFGNVKQADGVHYDAAFRVGRVKSDYNSDATSYDDGATYVGFSIGGGKEFKVSASDSVDVYGRYYFTHTNGSNVSLATHEQVNFDAVDSHRLRVGGRYTHEVDKKNQFYAGLAWQYEMGGDAKATINGYGAPVPSLKGHSGMIELGWKAQAAENVKLDLNLNGWVGKQRGIAGGVGVEFAF